MTNNNMVTATVVLVTSFCGGALATVLLGPRLQAQGSQAVTTTQVNLVDRDGVLRGVLSARDERGIPSLTLYDADGVRRGVFAVEDGGPVLQLRNADGEERLSARVAAEDALLIVGDERRTHGIFTSVSGLPVLSFADGQQGRAQLRLAEDGAPSLIFAGRDGQRTASVTVDDRNTPVMTFYEAGQPRVTLGVVAQAAVLNMTGSGESRVVIGVAGNGRSSVTVVDQAGQVVGELP